MTRNLVHGGYLLLGILLTCVGVHLMYVGLVADWQHTLLNQANVLHDEAVWRFTWGLLIFTMGILLAGGTWSDWRGAGRKTSARGRYLVHSSWISTDLH